MGRRKKGLKKKKYSVFVDEEEDDTVVPLRRWPFADAEHVPVILTEAELYPEQQSVEHLQAVQVHTHSQPLAVLWANQDKKLLSATNKVLEMSSQSLVLSADTAKETTKKKKKKKKKRRKWTKCNHCNWKFRKSIQLLLHRQWHSVACCQCGFTYSSKYGMNQHLEKQHGTREPCRCSVGKNKCKKYKMRKVEHHICQYCNLSYEELSQLKYHKKCTKASRCCCFCFKRFMSVATLRQHKKVFHPMRKLSSFQCKYCKLYFADGQHLKRHVYCHEKKYKTFWIKLSKKNQNSLSAVKKSNTMNVDTNIKLSKLIRSRINSVKPKSKQRATQFQLVSDKHYMCSFCLDTFPTVFQMSLHNEWHRKTHACCQCGLGFDTQSKLVDHKLTHHMTTLCGGSQAGQDISHLLLDTRDMQESMANQKCRFCRSSFASVSNLEQHFQCLYNNFVCCYCLKLFKTFDALTYHKRDHKNNNGNIKEQNISKINASNTEMVRKKKSVSIAKCLESSNNPETTVPPISKQQLNSNSEMLSGQSLLQVQQASQPIISMSSLDRQVCSLSTSINHSAWKLLISGSLQMRHPYMPYREAWEMEPEYLTQSLSKSIKQSSTALSSLVIIPTQLLPEIDSTQPSKSASQACHEATNSPSSPSVTQSELHLSTVNSFGQTSHTSKVDTKTFYKCTFCKSTFPMRFQAVLHSQWHFLFPCCFCGCTFWNKKAWINHTHLHGITSTCICQAEWANLQHRYKISSSIVEGIINKMCRVCDKSTVCDVDLYQHKACSLNFIRSCCYCYKVVKDLVQLNKHKRECHFSSDFPVSYQLSQNALSYSLPVNRNNDGCEFCDKLIPVACKANDGKNESSVIRECLRGSSTQNTQATLNTQYSCMHCSYKCTKRVQLCLHQKWHLKFVCCQCGSAFISENLLAKHKIFHKTVQQCDCKLERLKPWHERSIVKMREAGMTDNFCRCCGKLFSDSCHNLQNYMCCYCHKMYNSAKSLDAHKQDCHYHACHFCSKLFKTQQYWLAHYEKSHKNMVENGKGNYFLWNA